MTALELLAAFGERRLSPVEATEAALARIAAVDPVLNAFCLVDPEHALAAARASKAGSKACPSASRTCS
jgi:aspartyl-tRNA(Asn)/glutamyl-tRNA(Gln) amidotransferase subunit A